jgi:DNA-binding CsgD family transcriptional regulator
MTNGAGLPRPYAANLSVAKFAFPLRFLGFGFYWAWMTTFWIGSARSPLGMPTVEQMTMARIAVQTATALAFLVAVLFARRLMSSSGERLLVLGGAILGSAGTIVATLGQNQTGGGTPVYLVLAWVSLGVACACITLLWGRFYASIGLKRASLYTPLSLVLAVLVGLVLGSMQPLAAIALTTLLPLLSVGMFLLAAPELPPSQEPVQETRGRSQPVGALWRITLAIGVYGATLGFYLHSNALFGQGSPSSQTGRLVAFFVPLVTIVLLQRNDFGLIFRITLPLTAAGFLLLPLLGEGAGWIGAAIVGAGGTFFDILTWIALADIAHRGRLSPIKVFGLGRAANAGGIALGWMGSYVLLGTTARDPSPVLGFCVGMVFILILTTTLILREEDLPAAEVVSGASQAAEDGLLGPEPSHGPGHWRRCCARIAHEHDLSPREEEVMVFLAKGHSMKYIEETLVISFHTAKSHANHIHRKLGVHSREELIDLVETEHRRGWPSDAESRAGAGLAADAPDWRPESELAAPLSRTPVP